MGWAKGIVAAAACILMPWTAAQAETISGNDLYEACVTVKGDATEGFCVGHIIGTIEGLRLGAALPFMAAGTHKSAADLNHTVERILGICQDENVEYGQSKDVVIRYLTAHPESRHDPARLLILKALQEAFPCSGE